MIELPVKSEPVLVIVGGGLIAVFAILATVLVLADVDPAVIAWLFGTSGPIVGSALAAIARGRVSPVKESSHGM